MRLLAALVLLIWSGSFGCGDQKSSTPRTRPKTIVETCDWLYQGYLTNDLRGAMVCMEQAAQLIASSNNKRAADEGLWLCYARLLLIESVSGDTNRARLYYEKARYWLLRNLEAQEREPSDILNTLQEYTPEEFKRWAIEWDKMSTHGEGARFYHDSLSPVQK
jgi:hypothetical protein